eukprot:6186374-Pleurochrysis_carterae.AAC.4
MWDIPRDSFECSRSAAMLYVVAVATNVKTIVYMGLRAFLGCSTGSSRLYFPKKTTGRMAQWEATANDEQAVGFFT